MAKEPGPGPARRASDRGRYGRLNRERVLGAALRLVDREGLSALSMRRLGAELGVEAMALYRYAASKDALLDGLVEALHAELEDRLTAGEAAGDWRAELRRVALATYAVCLDHPQVVPLLSTRMLAVPLARRPRATLRHHERVLGLFEEAGFDTDGSARLFRAFTGWVLGYVSVELQAMVDNPEEAESGFRLGLHHMDPRELPRLRATTPALADRAGPRDLTDGLDALVDRFTHPG